MEVKFHLPGLRYNYPLNMFFVGLQSLHHEYFREGVKIASFFGVFPTALWNGGRFCYDDQCDATFVREVVKNINSKGIPIRYTYTNPMLTENDLDDEYCNFCMKAADNGMNEVLVVSPILEKYIREKYPSYKINSSTCKEIRDIDSLQEELEKDYNLVVLDYNMNNHFDILEKINRKEKCEILVNSCCTPDCPRRAQHYKTIAKQQWIILKNRNNPTDNKIPIPGWHCEYGDYNSIHTIKDYPTYVSPDDIWNKYVPMGYVNFKIEGRTANLFQLVDTYCHYMIKPEYEGEARLLLLTNLEKSKVITINKPRKGIWRG
jgi:collagenase-like PrtC family protease